MGSNDTVTAQPMHEQLGGHVVGNSRMDACSTVDSGAYRLLIQQQQQQHDKASINDHIKGLKTHRTSAGTLNRGLR
jgi:hypothetical protein